MAVPSSYEWVPSGYQYSLRIDSHPIRTALRPWFAGGILPVTEAIAECWGVLSGQWRLKGKPIRIADGLTTATLEYDLTLVARNVKDFAGFGVAIFNPWES